MNLPEYRRAIEAAASEYARSCEEARDIMLKAIDHANENFFEDETKMAVREPDRAEARR